MPSLLAIGAGYAVTPLLFELAAAGWRVAATTRSEEKAARLSGRGVAPILWEAPAPLPAGEVSRADAVIVSTGPQDGTCPAAEAMPTASLRGAGRILYLSASSVYGDHGGAWIDEGAPCAPGTARGRARLDAERQWRDIAAASGAALTLCRLAGIYGPGRNAVHSLRGGTRGARSGLAQRVVKPGHVFNRIHRDDIVRGLSALLGASEPPPVMNFADGHPSPPQDVIAFAAGLLGIAPPPEIAIEDADLSAMARSFYAENKRLANDRLVALTGPLAYPSYREGLTAIATG